MDMVSPAAVPLSVGVALIAFTVLVASRDL